MRLTLNFENIRESMKSIDKHGGGALGDPMEIPGTGLYVRLGDAEENRNSIL